MPWCYFRAEDNGEATIASCEAAGSSGSRHECAGSGEVTARSCTERGCCWAPGEDGEPWCFWPDNVDFETEMATISEAEEAFNAEL